MVAKFKREPLLILSFLAWSAAQVLAQLNDMDLVSSQLVAALLPLLGYLGRGFVTPTADPRLPETREELPF